MRIDIRFLCFIVLAFMLLSVCDSRGYRRRNRYRRKGSYGYSLDRKGDYGYSPSRSVSPYPRCRHSRTKIQVAVLDGNGTPVPYTKINYVDSKDYIDSSGLNQRWTDDLGVSRFVASGCDVSLIVYSKRGDPTYHQVDLTKSKTGLKKETVVLKNIANYLIYLVPTETDDDGVLRWSNEHCRYIYQSGKTTGQGQAIGPAPLTVRVETDESLKVLLFCQTGKVPAYLELSSSSLFTDPPTPAQATMSLPPYSLPSKEFGLVVGCNLADVNGVDTSVRLSAVYVYALDRNADDFETIIINWDCSDSPAANTYCYDHHFYIDKVEWVTTKDYLLIVEFFENGDIEFKGNCYAVDSNGKIKSAEIEIASGRAATPTFQIACVCKGTLKYWYPLNKYTDGLTHPASADDFDTYCSTCKNVNEKEVVNHYY